MPAFICIYMQAYFSIIHNRKNFEVIKINEECINK